MGICHSQSKPQTTVEPQTISQKCSFMQNTLDTVTKRQNFLSKDQKCSVGYPQSRVSDKENQEYLQIEVKDKFKLDNEKRKRETEIEEKSGKRLTWDSFQIICRVGKGSFGEVVKGVIKAGPQKGKEYAIKRMSKDFISKKNLQECIQLQKRIMAESYSHFITPLKAAFSDEYYQYLVMELAEGDTYSLVRPSSQRASVFQKAGEEAIRFILGCLILAIQYLHARNYIYRDIKAENLLIFSDGYIKLTDFGLSKQYREGQVCTSKAGTPLYYAPEAVFGTKCGKQIDLWGIGVLAYQLVNQTMPFKLEDINDKHKFRKAIYEGQKNRVWKDTVSEDLKDFINRLLKFDSKDRLGAKCIRDLKNHRFFMKQGFNWRKLLEKRMESPLMPILSCKLSYQPFIERKIIRDYSTPSKIKKSSQDQELFFGNQDLFI